MNKKNAIVIYSLIISTIGIAVYCYMQIPRVAYINSEEVFKKFKMTIELEAKFRNLESVRKNMIDSMEFDLTREINNMSNHKPSPKELEQLESKRRYFLQKKEEFNQDNQQITNTYNQSIWERINQYVKVYAQDKGYDYILGANGNGSIMYANESEDISEGVIQFINQQYDGK